MSSGVPFGMVTPREAIKEQVRAWKKERGNEFKVKRFRQIFKHLAKCSLPNCPVSLLDMPMRSNEYEAVIKEAYAVINERDEMQEFMRSLPAQANA